MLRLEENDAEDTHQRYDDGQQGEEPDNSGTALRLLVELLQTLVHKFDLQILTLRIYLLGHGADLVAQPRYVDIRRRAEIYVAHPLILRRGAIDRVALLRVERLSEHVIHDTDNTAYRRSSRHHHETRIESVLVARTAAHDGILGGGVVHVVGEVLTLGEPYAHHVEEVAAHISEMELQIAPFVLHAYLLGRAVSHHGIHRCRHADDLGHLVHAFRQYGIHVAVLVREVETHQVLAVDTYVVINHIPVLEPEAGGHHDKGYRDGELHPDQNKTQAATRARAGEAALDGERGVERGDVVRRVQRRGEGRHHTYTE